MIQSKKNIKHNNKKDQKNHIQSSSYSRNSFFSRTQNANNRNKRASTKLQNKTNNNKNKENTLIKPDTAYELNWLS